MKVYVTTICDPICVHFFILGHSRRTLHAAQEGPPYIMHKEDLTCTRRTLRYAQGGPYIMHNKDLTSCTKRTLLHQEDLTLCTKRNLHHAHKVGYPGRAILFSSWMPNSKLLHIHYHKPQPILCF